MEPFTTLTGRLVAMPGDHIDTDQIIPARFLKTISKVGLGQNLFADWRYGEDGRPNPGFPLNRPENQGAPILLAGDNFGCGSSREHAPWALTDFGFRAIISTSFADIFRNNALKNGLLPLIVDEATHAQLLSLVAEDPETEVAIDLDTQSLILPDGRRVTFPIDAFSKVCMLEGIDQLGYLLKHQPAIEAYEQATADRRPRTTDDRGRQTTDHRPQPERTTDHTQSSLAVVRGPSSVVPPATDNWQNL